MFAVIRFCLEATMLNYVCIEVMQNPQKAENQGIAKYVSSFVPFSYP